MAVEKPKGILSFYISGKSKIMKEISTGKQAEVVT